MSFDLKDILNLPDGNAEKVNFTKNLREIQYSAYRSFYIPEGSYVLLTARQGSEDARIATNELLAYTHPDFLVQGPKYSADVDGTRYFLARAKTTIKGPNGAPQSTLSFVADDLQKRAEGALVDLNEALPSLSGVANFAKVAVVAGLAIYALPYVLKAFKAAK